MIYGMYQDSEKILHERRKRQEGMREIGDRFDRDADREAKEEAEDALRNWQAEENLNSEGGGKYK